VAQQSKFASGRLLVVAFEGWNDAGEAASGALHTLKDQLNLVPIASLEPEDYFDYQFNRPTVTHDDSGNRELIWPSVEFYGPADSSPKKRGRQIFLLLGTEPSRSWKTFTSQVFETIADNDITGIVFLGAMLADVPHTRPISIFASSENALTREQLGLERSNYEGPVGILSVLSEAAERHQIPTVSIWASVPHYVHNAPSPKATLALIDRLESIIEVDIPRGDLLDEAVAWESGIDALASDDDDMSSYIEQLEQARDTVDSPEASGEAIAQEFERYLRRSGEGKPDGGSAGEDPWRP
jgi:PAC2 family